LQIFFTVNAIPGFNVADVNLELLRDQRKQVPCTYAVTHSANNLTATGNAIPGRLRGPGPDYQALADLQRIRSAQAIPASHISRLHTIAPGNVPEIITTLNNVGFFEFVGSAFVLFVIKA